MLTVDVFMSFLFHETAIMHRLITSLLLENNQQAGLVLHSGASHTYTTPNGAIFNNFSVFPFRFSKKNFLDFI